jgi:hypothetical protein
MADREFEIIDLDGYVHLFKTTSGALATCPEEHHTTFTEEYTVDGSGNIDAVAIITPTAGKKVSVHVLTIETDGAAGTVNLDFVTSSCKIARLYVSKTHSTGGGQDHTEGAVDEVITLSASGMGSGDKVFVKIGYVEED